MYSQNFHLLSSAANSTKHFGGGPLKRKDKFKANNNNSGSLSIENQRAELSQSQYKYRVSFNAKNAYRDIDPSSPDGT